MPGRDGTRPRWNGVMSGGALGRCSSQRGSGVGGTGGGRRRCTRFEYNFTGMPWDPWATVGETHPVTVVNTSGVRGEVAALRARLADLDRLRMHRVEPGDE